MLAKVIDSDDIRMTQFAGSRSFIPETFEHPRLVGSRECLDGDEPADSGVIGSENASETAAAQFRLYLISADLSNHFARAGVNRQTGSTNSLPLS